MRKELNCGIFLPLHVYRCFFRPLPSISWSGPRNNLPFERFRYSTYKTELNISNIIESDAGDYVCTAENKIGRYRHTLNIRVEGMSEPSSASLSLPYICYFQLF